MHETAWRWAIHGQSGVTSSSAEMRRQSLSLPKTASDGVDGLSRQRRAVWPRLRPVPTENAVRAGTQGLTSNLATGSIDGYDVGSADLRARHGRVEGDIPDFFERCWRAGLARLWRTSRFGGKSSPYSIGQSVPPPIVLTIATIPALTTLDKCGQAATTASRPASGRPSLLSDPLFPRKECDVTSLSSKF